MDCICRNPGPGGGALAGAAAALDHHRRGAFRCARLRVAACRCGVSVAGFRHREPSGARAADAGARRADRAQRACCRSWRWAGSPRATRRCCAGFCRHRRDRCAYPRRARFRCRKPASMSRRGAPLKNSAAGTRIIQPLPAAGDLPIVVQHIAERGLIAVEAQPRQARRRCRRRRCHIPARDPVIRRSRRAADMQRAGGGAVIAVGRCRRHRRCSGDRRRPATG